MSYVYIALTILFTVYGQIVIKWQAGQAGPMPAEGFEKIRFLMGLVLNPWILSGLFSAFLASVAWIAAMTKLPLSHAYPFVSISFILVMIAGNCFFHEALTWPKLAGMFCIVVGIVIGSKG